jgi:hypothetical protein
MESPGPVDIAVGPYMYCCKDSNYIYLRAGTPEDQQMARGKIEIIISLVD